jgi:aspartate/methionine/tyrosine aminotransferase
LALLDLPPFALERYFAPREFKARLQLSSSDCEALALADVVAGANDETRAAWHELKLSYVDTRGIPPWRAAIADLTGVSGDDVITCAPAEGIFLAMSTLLSAGDRVVATMPAYQSLYAIAGSVGCTVEAWPAPFDVDVLRTLTRTPVKMIVVNFPHNPTGALPTHDEWRAIIDIAREHGAWLFSDEMYRFLEHDDAHRLPTAAHAYERGVSLGGLSKSFSAPGLRAGWLACRDHDALEACAARKDYTTICGAGPSELLAVMVWQQRDAILARNRARVAENIERVRAFVERRPDDVSFTAPRAGCTALLQLRRHSAAALCDELFHSRGVLALPSTVFDFGDAHIRVGLGRDDFPGALAELDALLVADRFVREGVG